MRDQAWLDRLLSTIWVEHFHDLPEGAPIEIRWGKRARNRLGSLGIDPKRKAAVIRLTRLFTDPEVPELVIKATIVHELVHYAHGFSSGLEQRYRHPHKGGVIKQEFAERGLEDLYIAQKRWLKGNWLRIVRKHYPHLKFREPKAGIR